jgi:hypothetical protein
LHQDATDAEFVDTHFQFVGLVANKLVKALGDANRDHAGRLSSLALRKIAGSQHGKHFEDLMVFR